MGNLSKNNIIAVLSRSEESFAIGRLRELEPAIYKSLFQ